MIITLFMGFRLDVVQFLLEVESGGGGMGGKWWKDCFFDFGFGCCISSGSSPSRRHDEFMNEETHSFELVDDDDDMDGFEIRPISGHGKKKGTVSSIATIPCEDQDRDQDAEGEMEIDIEPFQDPSFNAEHSFPPTSSTSPTSSSTASSKSKSNLPLLWMQMMQMQQEQQQQLEEEAPTLVPSPLDSSTNPLSPSTSTSEGTPTSTTDIIDHAITTTAANDNTNDNDNHTLSMQIHFPPRLSSSTLPTTINNSFNSQLGFYHSHHPVWTL
ncbi:hypothetical protein BYT27DRAFT_7334517 [Phlegmacium glaucopus]|nr:hypothetical protein BYT27DRAFT_7334517 [Phlegmacium glaucopus]